VKLPNYRPTKKAAQRVAILILVIGAILGGIYAWIHHRYMAVPAEAECAAWADHRIGLHAESELPSIAKGIAEGREGMIRFCREKLSRAYLGCVMEKNTLAGAEACENEEKIRWK
jgi:hypothetical protein